MSGDSSKLHEMNPRKRRAASRKASRMRCAGTPRPASPLAPPATPKRNAQEWQDSRLMHDSRSPRSEKRPFLARSSRGVFPNGYLQGFSDAWRAYLAKASSFRIHSARILPKSAHFGCMAAICCQEGALFPSEAPFGIHEAQNLPRIDTRERTAQEYCHCQSGQERITAQSCHRRMPKSASRKHFAIVERLGTHRGIILPWQAARKCTAATPCHGSLLQECFSTTYCQEGPRLPELAAKSQWCHGVEKTPPERSVGQFNTAC